MKTPKGFNDYSGEDARKRLSIRKIIEEAFLRYGFEPAETPIIEFEKFVRGDNEKDSAVRDIFSLEDRGKRELALRFEFTFQLKRLAKQKRLPYRRYQIGYVFRDEPIKKGRTRQFIQCDADVVGSSIKDEAENLLIVKEVMESLGVDFTIEVNNRRLMNEILEEEGIEEKYQEEVIREIDKLDKLKESEIIANLKKYGAEKLLKVFQNEDSYFRKFNYFKEIEALKKMCKSFGVDFKFSPSLARGLSYYNGMVFEIKAKGLDVSVAGGGSYLVDKIQATGLSFGFEPLFLISDVPSENLEYLVLSIGQEGKAIEIASKLRENGNNVQLITDKSPSRALEYADSQKIQRVVFVGENEVKAKTFKVKNMVSGKEEEMSEKELIKS